MLIKKIINKLKQMGIKKTIKKICSKPFLAKCRYIKYYESLAINENQIILESQHGSIIDGNIYYILKELTQNETYKEFEVFVVANGPDCKNSIIGKTAKWQNKNFKIVLRYSDEYYRLMASAKFLINDTSFFPFWIKKDGQIYLNTWHGTPLKAMGKKITNDLHNIGNVQKNFIVADYLLHPNEFTAEHMIEDYMLENLSKANVLLAGYPRNSAFFSDEYNENIRKAYELQDKKIYIYMPTWRGTVANKSAIEIYYLQYFLFNLDKRLKNDEIFYVKLHPMVEDEIDFELFKHIKKFPTDSHETYEFLNVADCLITDYSSVMFDFANSGKKIVLFTYDKEEYLQDRGMYIDIDELPFPKVNNVINLIDEIRSPKNYDDKAFLEKFCKYDSIDITSKICQRVILNQKNSIKEYKIPDNNKPKMLIYGGNLDRNGVTASLCNLISYMDKDRFNIYLSFIGKKVGIQNKDILYALPDKINYIDDKEALNSTLFEKVINVLFLVKLVPFSLFWSKFEKRFKQNIKRQFGETKFDYVIQFNGYEYKKILEFSLFDAKRIIYVHSNMLDEIKTRGNQEFGALKYAYQNYDKVAIVSNNLKEPTAKISGKTKNIAVVHNLINHNDILQKGEMPLAFDDYTKSNKEIKEIEEIINDKTKKIFVNVGRYSPEKGHKRLIDAFNHLWKENRNIYLMIIGGNQRDGGRDKLLEYISTLPCCENIILILKVSNPFAFVKGCNYFVLSSFYEGFGLVLAEANILGLPVISTDIVGPSNFCKKHGLNLVENSENGIYEGMQKLLNGEIKHIPIDWEAYNDRNLKEFYSLLD